MSLSAYEDFYYAACLALDGDPVTAWERRVGTGEAAHRLGRRARRRFSIQAEGTDITLGVAGRRLDPLRGRAQHARWRDLLRPGRGQRRTVWSCSSSRPSTAGASPACGCASRTARSSTLGRPGRGVPHRDARHRRGRPPPRRARHRHQLRHPPRHQEILFDEKIGGTVHLALGRALPGDRQQRTSPPSTGTWSSTSARAARSASTAKSCSATAGSRSSALVR